MSKIQQSLINELAPVDTLSLEVFIDRLLSYEHIPKSVANASLQVLIRVMRDVGETDIGKKTMKRLNDRRIIFTDDECERIYNHFTDDIESVVQHEIDEKLMGIDELTMLDKQASLDVKKVEIAITRAITKVYADFIDEITFV